MNPVGLPVVADSALPRDVRDGSTADKKAYKAALGFEQLLVGQLVGEMTKNSSLAEGPRSGVVSDAMVTMIESQRAYQLTSKAIQTADQMWEIANGVKR